MVAAVPKPPCRQKNYNKNSKIGCIVGDTNNVTGYFGVNKTHTCHQVVRWQSDHSAAEKRWRSGRWTAAEKGMATGLLHGGGDRLVRRRRQKRWRSVRLDGGKEKDGDRVVA